MHPHVETVCYEPVAISSALPVAKSSRSDYRRTSRAPTDIWHSLALTDISHSRALTQKQFGSLYYTALRDYLYLVDRPTRPVIESRRTSKCVSHDP
ncbi:hypothetical protein E4U12_000231, partial [Claviceps purpurea]